MTRKPEILSALATFGQDRSEWGEMIAQLRLGVSKSQQLAEQLAGDPLVGMEARTLLAQLQIVTAELDFLEMTRPRIRNAGDGPNRGKPPLTWH